LKFRAAFVEMRGRDRRLGHLGYQVLRLDAELIRRDVHAAVAQVCAALGIRRGSGSTKT
jgi:hypothetical protein